MRSDTGGHAQRTFKVDRKHFAPQIDIRLHQRIARGINPGVIHEDIDATKPVNDLFDKCRNRIPIANVACEWQNLGASAFCEFGRDLIAQVLLAAAYNNLCAGISESVDHGPAQPFGRTSDDDDLAAQIKCRFHDSPLIRSRT